MKILDYCLRTRPGSVNPSRLHVTSTARLVEMTDEVKRVAPKDWMLALWNAVVPRPPHWAASFSMYMSGQGANTTQTSVDYFDGSTNPCWCIWSTDELTLPNFSSKIWTGPMPYRWYYQASL